MGIDVKKNARSAEYLFYLFYLFYLCSFTHGGRGTETTVLLLRRFICVTFLRRK